MPLAVSRQLETEQVKRIAGPPLFVFDNNKSQQTRFCMTRCSSTRELPHNRFKLHIEMFLNAGSLVTKSLPA